MKTSNYKTEQSPRLKRFTKYFCIIVVLCIFNLVALRAETPVPQTTTTDKQEKTSIFEAAKAYIQYLQLPQDMQTENRRFTLISNVMKNKIDEEKNAINNTR